MSLFLRAEVKGTRFDLDVQESIPLRMDISAVENGEIGKSFGAASQTFDLPGSKNNDTFFKAAFNVNSVEARGFYRSVNVSVIQNTTEVFQGKMFLQEVLTDDQGNNRYKVNVISETIDFATLIENQYLAQLDFSDLNHDYTSTNVTSSWDDGINSGDIIYPLVDYGTDGTQDFNAVEFGGTVGKIDNASSPMLIQQFKPAVRAKVIVDKIFESVGYNYSSSFFDGTEFNKMYVLTTKDDKIGVQNTSNQDSGFIARKTATQTINANQQYTKVTFPSEIYDPSNGYNTSISEFEVINAGAYAFKADLTFDKPIDQEDTVALLRVALFRNGSFVTSQSFDILMFYQGTVTFSTTGLALDAGDDIELRARYEQNNDDGSIHDVDIEADSEFRTIYAPAVLIGGNVDMAAQMDQELKSLDFMKGLIEKFNLVVEPKQDERNTLIIEPFSTWRDSGEQKDWSDKVDTSKKLSISHPIAKQPRAIKYSDGKDEDTLNKFSFDNFNSDDLFGTYDYTTTSDMAQGERTIGSFFSNCPTKGIIGSPQTIIPHLYKRDGGQKKSYKFKPRLVYRIDDRQPIGATGGEFFLQKTADPDNNHSITSYTTVSHLSAYPSSDSVKSLHFGGTWYPFHQNVANGFVANDAFATYWGEYINELYAPDARLLTCDMYFKPIDLIDIRLNDQIWIKDAYYRINKISGFNLTTDDVVKVELLKAPLVKFNFPITYIDNPNDEDPIPVGPTDFDYDNGFVGFGDVGTGTPITQSDFVQEAALNSGYTIVSSSVSSSKWFNDVQTTLNTDSTTNVGGTVTVDPSAGNVVGAADSSTIGQNVDKALIVGANLTLENGVKNSIISGDDITVGEDSIDTTILSGENIEVKTGSFQAVSLSSISSSINGTRNTTIGTSQVHLGSLAESTIAVGGSDYDMGVTGSARFIRHVHLGGAGFEFYATSSSDSFVDSVGIGDLPNEPINSGVNKDQKVIIGNAIKSGAEYINVRPITATPAGSTTLVGDERAHLIFLSYSGANGYHSITLADASVNEGRILRFKTDATINNSKFVKLLPSGSQTIDGGAEYDMDRGYDGISLLAHSDEWYIIQKKEK